MALTNASDIAKHVEPGLRTEFHKAIAKARNDWQKVATMVKSDQGSEDYAWLGDAPQMREFTDERQPSGLSEYSFTIENLEWENTIAVKRAALEDERYGQIQAQVRDLAGQASRFLDKKTFELLQDGDTATAYDGQNFFDTDHSSGASGTQSNKGTVALSAAEYATGRQTMMAIKGSDGTPLGVLPNLLVVPPELEKTAKDIVQAQMVSDGTTSVDNVYQGTAEIIVSPWLTDANNWYLLDTQSGAVKPLIVQERKPFEFVSQGADSHEGFFRNRFHFGGYWRGNFGYGRWEYAYGGIVA